MTEFIFFIMGMFFGISVFIALCFWKEIYDAVEQKIWDLKHFLRDKGLTK